MAEESVGSTYVTVTWAADAGLDEMVTAVQRHGKKKEDGLGPLGWQTAIETYRPMLTYDELGSLLSAGRSKLYDALATILGLEEVADAIKRLDTHSKGLAAPGTALASAKKQLLLGPGRDRRRAGDRRDRPGQGHQESRFRSAAWPGHRDACGGRRPVRPAAGDPDARPAQRGRGPGCGRGAA